MESPGPESAISKQRPPQISQPDQGERPLVVDPKNMSERADQLFDRIPDTRVAELTEKSEILADLRVLDRKGLAKLTAGNRLVALPLVGFELPQIQTDPARRRPWGPSSLP